MYSNNQIIIYQTEDGQAQVDVRMENETVWLTQAQMVELFQTTKQNIILHVGNVYKDGELKQKSTVKEYLTVQKKNIYKIEINQSTYTPEKKFIYEKMCIFKSTSLSC